MENLNLSASRAGSMFTDMKNLSINSIHKIKKIRLVPVKSQFSDYNAFTDSYLMDFYDDTSVFLPGRLRKHFDGLNESNHLSAMDDTYFVYLGAKNSQHLMKFFKNEFEAVSFLNN